MSFIILIWINFSKDIIDCFLTFYGELLHDVALSLGGKTVDYFKKYKSINYVNKMILDEKLKEERKIKKTKEDRIEVETLVERWQKVYHWRETFVKLSNLIFTHLINP